MALEGREIWEKTEALFRPGARIVVQRRVAVRLGGAAIWEGKMSTLRFLNRLGISAIFVMLAGCSTADISKAPPLSPPHPNGGLQARAKTVRSDWNVSRFASVRYPSAVAADGKGNVYVSSFKTNRVYEILASGMQVKVGRGFREPSGVAVLNGYVYVTDTKNSLVKKLSPTGVITKVGSGWGEPWGIAADSAGDIYVTDIVNETVSKVKPNGKVVQVARLSTCLNPTQVAIDVHHNVYVVCNDRHDIIKIARDGTISYVGSGWTSPEGIAVDRHLNLYVTQNKDGLYELTAEGELIHIAVNKEIPDVAGLAFRNGAIYVDSYYQGEIYKVTR